jgi:hypothetical protein
MAKVPMNSVTRHLQGRIGDIIFLQRDGRQFAQLRPGRSSTPRSAAQLEVQDRFKVAAQFARGVLGNPVRRVPYERVAQAKRQPLFSVIVGDYFKPPQVKSIDLRNYHGQAGEKILVTAIDDVEVVSVHVVIRDTTANAILEQGDAVKIDEQWTYTATAPLPAGHAATVRAIALDHATNEGDLTVPYPTS